MKLKKIAGVQNRDIIIFVNLIKGLTNIICLNISSVRMKRSKNQNRIIILKNH
jgi:hypothetical protein